MTQEIAIGDRVRITGGMLTSQLLPQESPYWQGVVVDVKQYEDGQVWYLVEHPSLRAIALSLEGGNKSIHGCKLEELITVESGDDAT